MGLILARRARTTRNFVYGRECIKNTDRDIHILNFLGSYEKDSSSRSNNVVQT